ncbi:hypothetical protein LDENG_00001210 [Lucifuga dentata]|nr:hypothetical protein LDENG_00001210 [Lucifuga dentata]
MDENDSQDELINCSRSHSKGKRAALWAISDSDDNEDGESDSDEEDEDDQLDREDEDNDEESQDEEDDEEEEDDKAEEGAMGGTSANLAAMSSDEDADKCPICLNSFSSQPVATPESCEHYFCLDCILEWSKNANSCPVDRNAFSSIYLRKCFGGKVQKMITVQKPVKEEQEGVVDVDLEYTSCEVCGGSDREDRLLLCDGCDAGYHMECLTPPLDAVPVEEWFCPECEANNRQSRASAEELRETENFSSSSRPASSRSRSRAAGPTRAIARTQQSERVRANVNRHRITQARAAQLAPTFLIQSTWLDETINAVVAGLNTAVYVRDLTPRLTSRRRRKTRKRKKVKSKKASFAGVKQGKAASTGVKKKRRKVRKTKSKRKFVQKKEATPRSRIANTLGIAKPKNGSSLPTVYRPSEHTLSSMRADIGAASLSIYGDPFDLDPFVDREEDQQEVQVTSLLEAKRRGISRSALRSHQPVARPVSASLSRRGMDIPQLEGVMEAAPVPDLLGSILSGQSMLLMDSSDVIINRDGSLKTAKPMTLPSTLNPASSKSSISEESSTQVIPEMSPNPGGSSPSLTHKRDLPRPSHRSLNRPFCQSSPCSSPFLPSNTSHTQPTPHSDLPRLDHQNLQPSGSKSLNFCPGHGAVGVGRTSSSIHPTPESHLKSKEMALSQSQLKKMPAKPMWVDVSALPRIPKIKRETSGVTNKGTSQDGSGGSNSRSSRGSCSRAANSNNNYGIPERGINNLTGDRSRQCGVDKQKGKADGQAQRPDRAGSSSSTFSNSFSSSSSSTGSSVSQSCFSSLSSSTSSSAVSFRINSSGNSWHTRRLSNASSTVIGGNTQDHCRTREDDARKKRLHRDKQMLLAARMLGDKEQERSNIYDPFDPTASDSSSSDEELESKSLDRSVQHATPEIPTLGNEEASGQSNQSLAQEETETQDIKGTHKETCKASAQEHVSEEVRCSEENVKVEQESRLIDTKAERETLPDIKVKEEPGLVDAGELSDRSAKKSLSLQAADSTPPLHHSLIPLKTEKEDSEKESGQNARTPSSDCKTHSSTSGSGPAKKNQKTDIKSESKSWSKSPSQDLGHGRKISKRGGSSKGHCSRSSSSETGRGKRGDQPASGQTGSRRGGDDDRGRTSRRARSRERRRRRPSTSDDSQSDSDSDMSHRKRHQSHSQSNRKQSRSGSISSSRERSRRKKYKRRSKERNDGRERDHDTGCASKDKRHGRSRSKSLSKSRSRSRERKRDNIKSQSPSYPKDKMESQSKDKKRRRSRSSSRERRKKEKASKTSDKASGSCISSSKDRKQLNEKKKDQDITGSSLKEESDVARVKKEEMPSDLSFSKVKREDKDFTAEKKISTAEIAKELEGVKEIKKEKQPFLDMFEDSPSSKVIKKEETDVPSPIVKKEIEKDHLIPVKSEPCETIKTEPWQIPIIKAEPVSPDLCHHFSLDVASFSTVSTLPSPSISTPVTADTLQGATSQAQPGSKTSTEQPDTVVLAAPVKQEVEQPSESDDDFNVDVMLDNLDLVKSEQAEGSGVSVKQEKEEEEGKNEGEQVPATVGTKSKTLVKRVTWNIQEPEGPQPEKSASKLALYKLKLKQEGARRTSLTNQTSSQDSPGTISDPSKKSSVGILTTSSRSDGKHPEEILLTGQTGEAEEGDLSRKDKYLKKLHMQERAIEEVKLAIKPFYQNRDINKDEYKEILRKAVQKICHSKSGEINPVKVGNLVKAYVDKYKHARKHKKAEDLGKAQEGQTDATKSTDSP